jgi:hypothetical protein
VKRIGAGALLLMACGGDGVAPNTATTTDSMGVTVVTATMPGWGEAMRWRVDTVPELEIGAADRLPAVLLVGVTSVARLADGGLVASTNEDKLVRWFGPDGAPLHSAGGAGEAEGRFATLRIAGLLGDSVLAWDEQLDRATVLGPDGSLVRSFRPGDDAALAPFGLVVTASFTDGRLLAASRSGALSGGASGLRRDTIALARTNADGIVEQLIARVPGHENVVVSGPDFVTLVPRPFGARTVVATTGTDVLVGMGDRDEVHRYRHDGTLTAIYRIDRPRRLIPATELAAQREQLAAQLAQLPLAMADAIATALADAGIPAVYPAHDQVLVDDTGAIWLREDIGTRRGRTESRSWVVLGADGVWLGTVITPARFEVHQVVANRLVGVWRDPNDVEHLRVHRLER